MIKEFIFQQIFWNGVVVNWNKWKFVLWVYFVDGMGCNVFVGIIFVGDQNCIVGDCNF